MPSLVAIGPQTAEELRNGQTDGQIQIIVWFKMYKKQILLYSEYGAQSVKSVNT